jgi:catechol 2,3-dioxygenase-like lactoylglutathione lyase family enzyme
METQTKPRLVGINHVALEVGDVEAALAFYGAIFSFTLRGSHNDADGRRTMAFIDMGDQFLALMEGQAAGARLDRYGCGTSGSTIPPALLVRWRDDMPADVQASAPALYCPRIALRLHD